MCDTEFSATEKKSYFTRVRILHVLHVKDQFIVHCCLFYLLCLQ